MIYIIDKGEKGLIDRYIYMVYIARQIDRRVYTHRQIDKRNQ